MSVLDDESAVRRLIAKFANSLDVNDWGELGECLAESVYTDFSEFRSTPPESLSRHDFVQASRAALEALKTHHLTGNVELYINGTSATARVSVTIFRREKDVRTHASHGWYMLGFECREGSWAICSIVQKALWSDA